MAESLVRSLIRLVVTVAILGAVYLFIVRPVLDTTNNTIDKAFQGSQGVVDQIQGQLDAANVDTGGVNLSSAREAQKLLRCIQSAGGRANRIERCVDRYG